MKPATYILPLRTDTPVGEELIRYVRMLTAICEVIVVDGSPREVFDSFAARCGHLVRHVAPDAAFAGLLSGKVAGVLTGLGLASHERIVIADDDVRYDRKTLGDVVDALEDADVVRPQHYFDPLPWHASIDTARTLINRVAGGDWPGTLAVQRSVLRRAGGDDGRVVFEDLELLRTIKAVGGREAVRRDVFVRRLPPPADRFVSRQVQQAYEELARPVRLAVWLSVLPAMALLARRRGARGVAAAVAVSIAVAETGRRIGGGTRVFPPAASLAAPLWLVERSVAAWLAVGVRLAFGDVPRLTYSA